ncbi:unnamed protein product [Cunninghamella blakesleeana]
MVLWYHTSKIVLPRTINVYLRHTSTLQSKPFRVLFFGTDEFASTHLKALVKLKETKNSCIQSLDLVCPPDKLTGRKLKELTPSETKGLAQLYNIPVHETPGGAKTLDNWFIPKDTYDLGVVVSFGYFIPPHVISAFKYGAINVHPSLLPKYRGAAPIQHTILQGENETGVTVQELDDKEFDAGRILKQTTVDLSKSNAPNYKDLALFLANVGSQLLVDTLTHFHEYKKNAITQDISQATKAPKIKKEWAQVDFKSMAAWQIEQLFRAIGEQYPLRTTFTFSRIKRSLLVKQKVVQLQLYHIYLPEDSPFYNTDTVYEPGTFMLHPKNKHLHVVCSDQQVIAITHLKAENKNAIKAQDFINGYEIKKTGQFDFVVDPTTVKPGQSGVRETKRRAFYEKTIRKRLGLRRETYDRIYKGIM